MKFTGAFWEEQGTAVVGTPAIVKIPVAGDVSVSVFPGALGSVLVETTLSSPAAMDAGTANWFAWTEGNVNVNTQDLAMGPVRGLRITATVANAKYEVLNRPSKC